MRPARSNAATGCGASRTPPTVAPVMVNIGVVDSVPLESVPMDAPAGVKPAGWLAMKRASTTVMPAPVSHTARASQEPQWTGTNGWPASLVTKGRAETVRGGIIHEHAALREPKFQAVRPEDIHPQEVE